MRKKIVKWNKREFVFLSCEGQKGATATEEMEDILRRLSEELTLLGLSTDHIVRTRLWGVDRESRDLGSRVRAKHNTGKTRAATSSYISPTRFESGARVGLDLVALKPSRPDLEKTVVENIPPRTPIDHLIFDSLLVLAGKTVVLPTLVEQLDEILPRITHILNNAGSAWEKVMHVSCYLHRSQKVDVLESSFEKWVKIALPRMEIGFVDGYSARGKLIEVEVTAELLS
jgi:enamine deaminase RidA (YjgF/YER057c/UK114 family)